MLTRIFSLIRFSHTLFALPFALLAGTMAWAENVREEPPVPLRWQEVLGVVLCMVFARSAAMAFNRIADRRIDAMNPRTADRHLPTGELSVASVAVFTVISALGFIASTLLFLPRNVIPVSASVPVLLFLLGYSYAKRFTLLVHFWLGAALMLAPVAAWVAIRPVFDGAPLVLGAAVMCWVAGFDIIYACQDLDFDRRMRLRSVPARLGVVVALRVAAGCHGAMVVLLAVLPLVYPAFGWVYGLGIGAIAALLAYEHWLVRPDDLRHVNLAFFYINAVVSVGLFVVGVIDLVV